MTYDDCYDDYGDLLLKSMQDMVNIPFGVYKQAHDLNCYEAWLRQHKRALKHSWSDFETEQLAIYLRTHEENWKEASKELSRIGIYRTPQYCQYRWYRVVNPELVKGRWTKEEDNYLRILCNSESDILRISQMMCHRSYVQVRNRMKRLMLGKFAHGDGVD